MENQIPSQQQPSGEETSMQETPVQLVKIVDDVPECAKISGIVAIIAAAFSLIIPIVGTLFISPVAIIITAIALWGGAKKTGAAAFIIIVLNLVISPTFWLNVYASFATGGSGNVFLAWFDVIGVVVMIAFLIRKRKKVALS